MVINENTYTLPNLDYNTICELELKHGINVFSADFAELSPFVICRAFVGLCMGSSNKAGEELQKHMAKHGVESLAADILPEITESLTEGGFMKTLRVRAEALAAEKAAQAEAEKAAEEAAKSKPAKKEKPAAVVFSAGNE